MRKLLVAVMAIGLVAIVSATSFAFTSSLAISTLTATAQFTAAGSVNMSYQFMNLTGGTTNQIYWNTGAITLGSTSWYRADSYMLLSTTMTASGGAVRIYTDNLAADASPKYGFGVQPSTNSPNDPEGLVASSSNTKTLAMCWRVSASTITPAINQGGSGALTPGTLWDTATGNQFPCYLWMMDKGTYNFYTGAASDYSIIRDSGRGIQYSEAGWGATQSNVFVYFGANFATATTPNTYRTQTLRLESFYE